MDKGESKNRHCNKLYLAGVNVGVFVGEEREDFFVSLLFRLNPTTFPSSKLSMVYRVAP